VTSRTTHTIVPKTLVAALLFCAATLFAQTPSFVAFDAPDAVQGTNPVAINTNGVVTGYYYDLHGAPHGFVRLSNGQITEFDPPGLTGTFPTGIDAIPVSFLSQGRYGYHHYPRSAGHLQHSRI